MYLDDNTESTNCQVYRWEADEVIIDLPLKCVHKENKYSSVCMTIKQIILGKHDDMQQENLIEWKEYYKWSCNLFQSL